MLLLRNFYLIAKYVSMHKQTLFILIDQVVDT